MSDYSYPDEVARKWKEERDQLLQRNKFLEEENERHKSEKQYFVNQRNSLEKENERLKSNEKAFEIVTGVKTKGDYDAEIAELKKENERQKKEIERYAWEHGQQVDFERKRDTQIADLKIIEKNYYSVSKAFDEAVQSEASLKQRLSVLELRAESYRAMLAKLLSAYQGAIEANYWRMGKEYLSKGVIENDSLIQEAKAALESEEKG